MVIHVIRHGARAPISSDIITTEFKPEDEGELTKVGIR